MTAKRKQPSLLPEYIERWNTDSDAADNWLAAMLIQRHGILRVARYVEQIECITAVALGFTDAT